mmetsp:Transcript_75466/g.234941  ORF Transcript_75466/g.234941 Transcript_75466/m.234941 type:complete len:221 (+) Transcript_75466:1170-1832(+)
MLATQVPVASKALPLAAVQSPTCGGGRSEASNSGRAASTYEELALGEHMPPGSTFVDPWWETAVPGSAGASASAVPRKRLTCAAYIRASSACKCKTCRPRLSSLAEEAASFVSRSSSSPRSPEASFATATTFSLAAARSSSFSYSFIFRLAISSKVVVSLNRPGDLPCSVPAHVGERPCTPAFRRSAASWQIAANSASRPECSPGSRAPRTTSSQRDTPR